MSDELLRELNEIRLEEGINKKIFEHVVALTINFKEEKAREIMLSEEELKDIVLETLSRLDHKIVYENGTTNSHKTTKEAFENTLKVLGYTWTK